MWTELDNICKNYSTYNFIAVDVYPCKIFNGATDGGIMNYEFENSDFRMH